MDYLLDLLQGLGIAAAIGIRPFLPTLLVGALAAADVGMDFEGTDFAFLEGTAFLLAIVVARRRVRRDRPPARRRHERGGPVVALLLAIALVLGALLASGSIADHSEDWWPGLIVGAAAAALGFAAARSLFGRVRARLDAEAAGALPLYAEGAALLAAGLSILLPAAGGAGRRGARVAARRRAPRRAGEKYAGLRISRR